VHINDEVGLPESDKVVECSCLRGSEQLMVAVQIDAARVGSLFTDRTIGVEIRHNGQGETRYRRLAVRLEELLHSAPRTAFIAVLSGHDQHAKRGVSRSDVEKRQRSAFLRLADGLR
jgi:hypothetical protein